MSNPENSGTANQAARGRIERHVSLVYARKFLRKYRTPFFTFTESYFRCMTY